MHSARRRHFLPALLAILIPFAADPSIADCDPPGAHVTWRSGIIDRHYVPGEGYEGAFLGAAACGSYLITPTDWNGVRSYAIVGAGQLELRDDLDIDFCEDIVGDGSHAYLAAPTGLLVLSIDANGAIEVISSLSAGYGRSIEKQGDYIYLATPSGLEIIDVSSPAAPLIVGHWDGDVTDVTVEGMRAYVPAGNDGIHSLDISDPSHPVSMGPVIPHAFYRGVESDDGYLYVCRSSQGLTAYDLGNPDVPMQVAHLPALSRGFALAGDYALANSTAGIQLVDLSDPEQPVVTGFYRGLQLGKVTVVDEVAYMACGLSGLQAIFLGDRANQPPIATLPEIANGKSLIRFEDDLALLLGNDLRIFSLADPTAPTAVGSLVFATPRFLGVSGDHAYVVDQNGFHSIDLSVPSAPQVIATIPTPFSVEGIRVAQDRAYLWQGAPTRVATIDISDPHSPTLLGSANVPVWSTSFTAGDNMLYFAEEEFEGWCTVSVWDFTDPIDPDMVGASDLNLSARSRPKGTCSTWALSRGWPLAMSLGDISDPLEKPSSRPPSTPGTTAGFTRGPAASTSSRPTER